MHSDYLARLDHGVTLVTPSRRLASLIADRYNAQHARTGSPTWEAPLVLPFSAWVNDSFQRLALDRQSIFSSHLLLSAEQERALWEQVIRASNEVDFDQIDNLAALAMNAWSIAQFWKIPLDQIIRGTTREEVRAFDRWARAFQQRCQDLEAVDQSRFATSLRTIGAAISTLLPPFDFFGYARLSPTLAEIRAFANLGANVPSDRDAKTFQQFEYRVYPNSEAELNAAMEWAGEKKLAAPDSDVVIALTGSHRIDPSLAQRLRRVLSRSAKKSSTELDLDLGFSSSSSFSEIPMVRLALLILDWKQSRDWDELSQLLLSPYLGAASRECDERALLDCDLRRHGDVEVSISWAVEAARSSGSCTAFVQLMEDVTQVFESVPKRQRLHDWMSTAEKMLSAAGWPGENLLDEGEQLALLEWHRVMDSLAQLDAVLAPCSWPDALRELRSVLRGRSQPSAPSIDAIQLVTLEEASFLEADALWIADLHDGAWPALNDTNPLLPMDLQRLSAVPGTDPERDLRDAEHLLKRISRQNGDSIWSFGQTEGETERRPLSKFEAQPLAPDPVGYWPHGGSPGRFVSVPDGYATALDSNVSILGGVSVFTDQAACPMRAVAKHRLHSHTPADATPGLSPLQRGNLIHAVMALFWSKTKNSDRLHQMSDEQANQLTTQCVDSVVADFRRRYRFIDAYWDLEAQRLSELTSEWLVEERNRGSFEVVACEESRVAAVGGFVINTRVDRVDRLPNGTFLIIDYKTGAIVRSSWDAPRPDQPQLPIYAVSARSDESIGGIAFAGLRKGKCRLVDEPRGSGSEALASDESAAEWRQKMQEWQDALDELAGEIRSGQATVNPKRGAATCGYCDLQVVCRIHEVQRERIDDEQIND